MAKIGYGRVSTEEQNEARQVEALLNAGVEEENLFIDKKSGKDTDRKRLNEMLAFVRKGDVVITESISRIARNTKHLLEIVEILNRKGVEFISMKESIDTTTSQGRFMLTVFAAMAELERENILERQREGIAIAKAEGKYKGRKPIAVGDAFFAVTKLWVDGVISLAEAQRRLDMAPATFFRKCKEYGISKAKAQ